ncbi:unnamed protein product [Prorocentrum cordatum]|uniref:Ku domain-containing protein n=1 Tax=Prorocentrum cordatum TaxID=2364126 RepID=A0ABN9U414_9DINO|nr:unnamed protein product [Polarella glacialis]
MCVKPVEQRCKVRMVMTISPDVQIPIGVYSKTVRAGPPSMKKCSKGPAGAAADPAGAPSAGSKDDGVIVDRTYRLVDDPEGEEVKKEDMIKGHKYGQSIVPMSEYDEAALMYTCERTLTALGFARADAIGPEHSMQQVDVVAADLGNRWAHCAFESLVDAMVARDVALVARYSFRKNAQPRLVALFPSRGPRGSSSSLVMQYLPFEEDIREWVVASLPATSAVQRDAVSVLLDSMSLEEPASGRLDADEALRPEDTHNPCLSRFYSFLTRRAMDAAAKVPGPGPEMLSMLEPPAHIAERAVSSGAAELLKGAFAFERVEKKVGKKRTFWREAVAQKRSEADIGEVDVKRIRVDGVAKKDEDGEDEGAMKKEESPDLFAAPEMAAPVDSAPPAPLLRVGTVNPVRDFEQWLACRPGCVDTAGAAIQQMCGVVDRLVEERGQSATARRSAACRRSGGAAPRWARRRRTTPSPAGCAARAARASGRPRGEPSWGSSPTQRCPPARSPRRRPEPSSPGRTSPPRRPPRLPAARWPPGRPRRR